MMNVGFDGFGMENEAKEYNRPIKASGRFCLLTLIILCGNYILDSWSVSDSVETTELSRRLDNSRQKFTRPRNLPKNTKIGILHEVFPKLG